MAVYAVCECGKPYRFRNEDAGKRIKCASCGAMITAPGRAADPGPAADLDLASTLELAAATEKAAAGIPQRKSKPLPVGKVLLMAGFGVAGAVITVVVIAVACSLCGGPSAPDKKPTRPAAPAAVSPPVAPEAAVPAAEPPTTAAGAPEVVPESPSAPAATSTEPAVVIEPLADPSPSPEKEQEVLRLLKKCTSAAVTYVSLTSEAGAAEDEEAINRAGEFARTCVLRKGPADGLRPAAAEVVKFGARAEFTITVLAEAGPDLELLQQLLGKESRTETNGFFQKGANPRIPATLTDSPEPTGLPVTWHHYGWLIFGAAGGKVVAVRADCRRLQADLPPAPAPVPATAATPSPPVAAPPSALPPRTPAARPAVASPSPTPERERQALALLGTDFYVTVSCVQRYTLKKDPTPLEGDDVSLARAAAATAIRDAGPATGLRTAATMLAPYRDRAKFTLTVLGDGTASIASIRAILGKESLVEQRGFFNANGFSDTGDTTSPRVTWYHYGWLAFAAIGDKVVGVRGDCQKLTPGRASAPKK
jgi:hypothetical protein